MTSLMTKKTKKKTGNLMLTIKFVKDSQRFVRQVIQVYPFSGSPLHLLSLLPSLLLLMHFLQA